MKKLQIYKIAIFALLFIIILQGLLILKITKVKKIPKVPVGIKGKMAIVIDDWGYNLNNLAILDNINYPLTISVLPNLNYSQVVSLESHRKGFEIILHLPMQPHEKFRLEKNTIMTSMDESTIKNILEEALITVRNTSGVSNHMGSLVTEDSKIMEIIFKELKRRRLYFLDSLVSSKSVCFDLAHRMNLDFAKRDVFLDNIEEPQYIRSQIYKLRDRVKIYGQAIGIGHDRRVTLEVLKEVMPELARQGYKFVFVSELVRQ